MSHKSRVNFGTTIAALFAISIFAYAGDAKADRDYPDFIANFYPDFVANLDAEQVPDEPGDPGFSSQSVASGKAKFWLNNDRTELHYEIKLKHIDLIKTGTTEAVTKIHLHSAPANENGPHVLNIFGAPSFDDDDLFFFAVKKKARAVLKGIYDDGDENLAAVGNPNENEREGGDSVALTGFDTLLGTTPLEALCYGNFYVNVHSDLGEFENAVGAIRGQVLPTDDDVCGR